MKRKRQFRPPIAFVTVIFLLTAAVVIAQPQSPNFTMRAQTLSAGGMFDSSANYTLFSSVCSWSVADTHASANYRLTSGFLTPNYGSATGAFLVVNPPSLNFGEVHVDSTSTLNITLSDTGYWNLTVAGMLLSQGTLFQFNPLPQLPDTVYARSSLDYILQFHPTATGLFCDTLTITHDGGNPVVVLIEGSGVAPSITIDPDTLAFGDIWIGRAVHDTFSVQNPGSADLHVSSITTNNPVFPPVTTPFTVLRGGSHAVPYTVTVPETLSYSGLLTIHSDGGNPTVLMSAHGVWTELHISPTSIDLGSVAVADTVDTTLTLTSAGNTYLVVDTVRLTNNHFSMLQYPTDSIFAYGITTVSIRFVAQTVGTYLDTLVALNNVGDPVRIPLSAGVSSVNDDASLIPKDFFLDQNYPNPFNPATNIRFGLPRAAQISIEVFDILGRKTATLADGRLQAGYHSLVWNCSTCPSGMYLIRMQTEDRVFLRKMLLMK
ncbi:T9SS C-terminal target domain-containing protein [candidate division KSB1 bacterium]|nr:MAG: T9SS C-terminal target domain-containing protein [candidate division KSB1 bacterium]